MKRVFARHSWEVPIHSCKPRVPPVSRIRRTPATTAQARTRFPARRVQPQPDPRAVIGTWEPTSFRALRLRPAPKFSLRKHRPIYRQRSIRFRFGSVVRWMAATRPQLSFLSPNQHNIYCEQLSSTATLRQARERLLAAGANSTKWTHTPATTWSRRRMSG
jgi:hypothetical protein